MSNFDSNTSGRTSAAAAASDGVSSATDQAPGVGISSPLANEEAIFSEQPTGDIPSAEEMEDRKDATSSSDNLIPKDKLENGLRHAKMLFATGWASVAATYRDLERTETAEKIKEGTINLVDKSLDGLSKLGCAISETTEKGVQVVGAKLEEAAPTLGRWRDEAVIASERGLAAAKDMTDKAIAEIKKPGRRSGGGGPAAGGSAAGGTGSDDGPHTV